MNDTGQPTDNDADDGVARAETSELEKNVKSKNTWVRLLFMIVMGIAGWIAMIATGFVVLVNFCYVLFTGNANSKLTGLGHSLAIYLSQIVDFMTFNTETRPFPIDEDWPSGSTEG